MKCPVITFEMSVGLVWLWSVPTKRQRLVEWIQKQDPYICCLQETHLETSDTYRLKVRGWKKTFHANRDQKKAEVAIVISDKIDF